MIALLAAAAAHAGCGENPALATGPVQAWLWDGMHGLAVPTCAVDSVGVAPRASLLVDTPNFYGKLQATGTFDAVIAPDDRTAVGLALEPLHYESVISAISTSWFGYGATSVSASRRVESRDAPVELAMVGRLAVPTPVDRTHNPVLAADLGLAVASRPAPVEGHLQFGLSGSTGLRAPAAVRTGLPLTGGVGWSAGRHFGLAADLQGMFGYWATVDHVALAPALRFAGRRAGLEVGASVPVVGRERTLTAVRIGWRWFPGSG